MADLPTPDFTFDPNLPGACITGVRPRRNGAYRLSGKMEGTKFVVHNYGHGGCGISLSWGCAAKVQKMVRDHLGEHTRGKRIAVIGAGVMGLTVATLLLELDLDLQISIYSHRDPLETTSAKAGGQWSVSGIEYAGKKDELGEILRYAYHRFKDSIGQGFGVSELPNYTAGPAHNLDIVFELAPNLLPPREALAQLPFAGHHHRSGYKYTTLLIEPPIFLRRLVADLAARGVVVQAKRFEARSEVLALGPGVIVNCSGMGALRLWNDARMVPVRGRLAMLPPQPNLHYLYGQEGYMFPRQDHVVIGGTFDSGVDDEMIDKAECRDLVDVMRANYGLRPPVQLADNHIHNPLNAKFVEPRTFDVAQA